MIITKTMALVYVLSLVSSFGGGYYARTVNAMPADIREMEQRAAAPIEVPPVPIKPKLASESSVSVSVTGSFPKEMLEPISLEEAQSTIIETTNLIYDSLSDDEYKEYKTFLRSMDVLVYEFIIDGLAGVLAASARHVVDARLVFDDQAIAWLQQPETRALAILSALKGGLLNEDTALAADFNNQILHHKVVRFGKKIQAILEEKFPGDTDKQRLLKSMLVTITADQRLDDLFAALSEALKEQEQPNKSIDTGSVEPGDDLG